MGFVVKNTTKWRLIDLVCPHSCRGCGRLGAVLCDCCKNDIILAHRPVCPLCREIVAEGRESCPNCDLPFERVFVVGWREGALEKLVKDFKYGSVRAAGEVLVELMDVVIAKDGSGLDDAKRGIEGMSDGGAWSQDVVVVPLPTIGKHVRERGLDHTLILAKKLAKRRGWKVERLLAREADTVQVGAKAAERKAQAEKAYRLAGKVEPEKEYLLLDDVWTTGATMLAAAKALQKGGARHLSAAVIEVGRIKQSS